MKPIHYLVHQIPFFSGKRYFVHQGIYHNDAYPACLLVQSETKLYKIRFPGILNANSVESEKKALKLLSECCVEGIPEIVAEGIVDGVPYLIEYYIEGSSLDKIYHTLLHDDWVHIAHSLTLFLQKMTAIRGTRPSVFKSPEKKYDCYGDVIKESILRHLDQHSLSGIISPTTASRIRKAVDDINWAFHTDATFLHFDIKPQNIVFDTQNKRVAFIDYEHSRMGDYTHELFRIDMAVIRNPYFGECWRLAKQEFLTGWSNEFCGQEYSYKLFCYELLYHISEMTYSVLIGDNKQISAHLTGIEDKLRSL